MDFHWTQQLADRCNNRLRASQKVVFVRVAHHVANNSISSDIRRSQDEQTWDKKPETKETVSCTQEHREETGGRWEEEEELKSGRKRT